MNQYFPIDFPDGITDVTGRRLRPGSTVCVLRGPSAGGVGEVVGWGGRRGVEVLLDTDPPLLIAVPARRLARVDREVESVTTGRQVVERSRRRVCLVVPIGAQDIQRRPGARLLPERSAYQSERETRQQVDARRWGEALEAALADLPDGDQVAARELDAPMVRRLLVEAALPARVQRLVLVVTDQTEPHVDDTAPFGRVLLRWLRGSGLLQVRPVVELAEPLVLREAPHVLDAVVAATRAELPRILAGCDRLAVVQAGGTPAMPFGVLLAAATAGIDARHIQVPYGAPLIEVDFPALAFVGRPGFGPRTAPGEPTRP